MSAAPSFSNTKRSRYDRFVFFFFFFFSSRGGTASSEVCQSACLESDAPESLLDGAWQRRTAWTMCLYASVNKMEQPSVCRRSRAAHLLTSFSFFFNSAKLTKFSCKPCSNFLTSQRPQFHQRPVAFWIFLFIIITTSLNNVRLTPRSMRPHLANSRWQRRSE